MGVANQWLDSEAVPSESSWVWFPGERMPSVETLGSRIGLPVAAPLPYAPLDGFD
jgi:hypothetical protein